MTVTEVLPAVAQALQGSLDIFFRVLDGLEATNYVFGALVVVTIFRLLLMPLIGGRTPNEIRISATSDDNVEDKDLGSELRYKKYTSEFERGERILRSKK